MERRRPAGLTGSTDIEVDTAGLPQGQPMQSENPQEAEAATDSGENVVPEERSAEQPQQTDGPQVVLVSSYGKYETDEGTFVLGEPQAVSEDAANDLVALRGPHGEELFRRV